MSDSVDVMQDEQREHDAWTEFWISQGSPAEGTLAYGQARFDFTDDGSILEEEDL